jgi:hypothetical protein
VFVPGLGPQRPVFARCAEDGAVDFTNPEGGEELGFLGVAVFLPAADPDACADSEGTFAAALDFLESTPLAIG